VSRWPGVIVIISMPLEPLPSAAYQFDRPTSTSPLKLRGLAAAARQCDLAVT
jgi:hypothetical protein